MFDELGYNTINDDHMVCIFLMVPLLLLMLGWLVDHHMIKQSYGILDYGILEEKNWLEFQKTKFVEW